jgi:hypothetical protein
MKNKFSSVIIALFILVLQACKKDDTDINPVYEKKESLAVTSLDAAFLTDWQKVHLDLIKTTAGYMPPVAARSLAYTSLAAYECLVPGMSEYKSMVGRLNGLDKLPVPDSTKEYNWALATSTSQYTILKDLFASSSDKNQLKLDSIRVLYETKFKNGLSDAVISNSIRFGGAMAASILEYSKKDGGANGAINNFPPNYGLPTNVGAWRPTGNQKIPLLPQWGNNRPFLKSNTEDGIVDEPNEFSFEKTSEFFKEGRKVYTTSQILTDEQKNIAKFFEDGVGTVTPPGHFTLIMNKIISEKKYKLDQRAIIMLKMGLALNDAFIVCWKYKYRYNYMRPQTYINDALDKNWKSIVNTPPFPDYPSGHTVAASVFYSVMEKEFGKDMAFVDDTYQGVLPNRTFNKLDDFLQEATNSRLYAGIHYNFSCTAGVKAGKKIGNNVLALKMKK